MKRLLAAALLLALSLPCPASAQPTARRAVGVAAASSLKIALEALEPDFEATHPDVDVVVTLGASGVFVPQIQNGAPFDLFLSADREYPRMLVDAGLAAPGGEVVYAIGRLVAWAPKGSPLELPKRGLAVLAGPGVKRLAIANPAVAPWGRAAEAALRSAGLLDAVRGRLVYGRSVAHAAQLAWSGAADAALLPLALTFAPELVGGRIHHVPFGTYPAQEQSGVVLRDARQPELASAFLRYLTGPQGRALLAARGYALP